MLVDYNHDEESRCFGKFDERSCWLLSLETQDILSNYKELFRIQFFLSSFGRIDECTRRAL